ncbi:envelope stress response membrane protein PspC [Thioalkalivibrio sp. XN8]|uniref:envelope stress response membrane protein PspC n=1 Tax=Thioalkalivibrio sp. XN8 TaxID=2712863 RepID=UPI0013EA7B8D|nr:envelope stress response membrane protein PspC [Thioalkalivibrio sp. XN8]
MKREPNPARFYRDPEAGRLGGVCAGIADYFGFDLTLTRVLTIIGMLFFPTLILVYVALWWLLPTKPGKLYRDAEDQEFWRGVRVSPAATLSDVRHRFRSNEARLQRMERYVTSRNFGLDREFQDLERGD